ncbi:MAG: hypothetical protein ACLQM8_18760 [Limisphaerales bacterium]
MGVTAMEYGSLKAEYRPGAGNAQLGPCYQHQVWEHGRNRSRRVPAPEAAQPTLRPSSRKLVARRASMADKVKVWFDAEADREITPAREVAPT